MKTYAVMMKNDEIRKKSSSGGMFSVLAGQFDVVYGVSMTQDCYGAEMVRVEGDIGRLRGSKYFQAKVGDIFKQVEMDLMIGKRVLFSGTGCQINGLSCYLGKEYSNLFLLDVVCHGVPSPKLWREYVSFQEKKHGKLESVNFRCKEKNWKDFGMKENCLFIAKEKDAFMRMFLQNYCLRPSCYECHAKTYIKSDMTIADFWGIENIAPEMNDGLGTSLVICRSDKSLSIFERIRDKLKCKEVNYKEAVKFNPAEYSSVKRPAERDYFFDDLSTLPFEVMKKKYATDTRPWYKKVLSKCKRVVKYMRGGGGTVKSKQ